MSEEIEKWIDQALLKLGLDSRKIETELAGKIHSEVEERFVIGSPRVWWLGLRSVLNKLSSGSTKLSALVFDSNLEGLFIPEIDSGDPIVYRLSANEIEDVVQGCPYFEYYYLCDRRRILIAETDHNEFLIAKPFDEEGSPNTNNP